MTIWHEIALGICLAWTLFSFFWLNHLSHVSDKIVDFIIKIKLAIEKANER